MARLNGVHFTKRGPYITTFSGKRFFPLDVKAKDIDINDIAHALSLQCRFSGHVRHHYSVAQHSLYVADLVPDEFKLEALLHDASEAYLVDVPSPIKQITDFSRYRSIEKATQDVIYEKYGITKRHKDVIKEADLLMLATEARQLLVNNKWAKKMPVASIIIDRWKPIEAEDLFIEAFELYTENT